MIIINIFLCIIFSFQPVRAVEYKTATDIVNQCSHMKVLSVGQARDLIADLWSLSFCCVEGPSPVQQLTNGFQFLLQSLENIQQKSLVEQAYLMWCSGRTHGFSRQGSAEDAKAIKSILYVVARNVATSLMESEDHLSVDSLTSTGQVINNMLQDNTVDTSIRRQDDTLVDSIRTELCELWFKRLGIKPLVIFVNLSPLEKRSISGIWNAYCKDVWEVITQHKDLCFLVGTMPKRYDRQKREYDTFNERVTESRGLLSYLNDEIRQREKILLLLQNKIGVVQKQKQCLEHDVRDLSTQMQQIQEELRHLEKARELSQNAQKQLDEESAYKRRALQTLCEPPHSQHSGTEETDVVRSLFSTPASSTRKFWYGSTHSKFLLGGGGCILVPMLCDYSSGLHENNLLKTPKYPGLWTLLSSAMCHR